MRIFKSLLLLSFIINNSCAQVKDGAFDVMLNGLLSNSVEQIEVKDLKKKLHEQNLVLLDARELNEFEVSHIEGAINVGYDKFNKSEVKNLPKESQIIVYCSVGYRSEKIGEKLKKMGFNNVKNLRGGIFEWKNENNPVVNKEGQTTNNVHAFDKTWGLWLNNAEKVYD